MSDPAMESTRRRLTAKQADTVDRLGRAAVELLNRQGFAALTVRRVAADAGVGAATAYTYFSSKEHLVAEVFWRRLVAAPSPDAATEAATGDVTTRVVDVLRRITALVADEPDFACAVTSALLGRNPDVEVLRQRIGCDVRARIAAALGAQPDPDVVDALELLYSGALVRAGVGHPSPARFAERLEKSVRLLMGQVAGSASPMRASVAATDGPAIPPTSRPAST